MSRHGTARGRATRSANVLLGSRFRLLAVQTLVHYPTLWWAAAQRARVPLHVSVTSGAAGVTMIAGPGGVGKSTMLSAGLTHGEIATADNICACDSRTAYGLVEPLRVAGGAGPPAPHGRREIPLPGRVRSLDPDRLVVLGRAPAGERTTVRPLSPEQAARALVAGTYTAGELRRFWPFAATLALATGIGPAHPDVMGMAGTLAARLACVEVRVAHGSPAPIGELLRMAGAACAGSRSPWWSPGCRRARAGSHCVALSPLTRSVTRPRSSLVTPTASRTQMAAATSCSPAPRRPG